jgi:hypothetical protein
MRYETYYATDRRVYNGALCSDMQRQEDHTEALLARLVELEPDAFCTYFPMEGKWNVSRSSDYKSIIPSLVYGKQEAIITAIRILEAQ